MAGPSGIKKPIILHSIRGRKNWVPTKCRECGKKSCFTTTYTRSNIGKVTVCDVCKPTVKARSKGGQKRGKYDMMNRVTFHGVSGN